jgi:DNA-binding NarL/FixJ family response regulator
VQTGPEDDARAAWLREHEGMAGPDERVVLLLFSDTGGGHRRAAEAVATALDDLTAREREVVTLIASGLSNDEIAGQLYVSASTVKTHAGRAMMKLAARDRAQLVVAAYETGLVLPGR